MITLVPLCTMALTLGQAVDAGSTPAGQHMAAEITSATVRRGDPIQRARGSRAQE